MKFHTDLKGKNFKYQKMKLLVFDRLLILRKRSIPIWSASFIGVIISFVVFCSNNAFQIEKTIHYSFNFYICKNSKKIWMNREPKLFFCSYWKGFWYFFSPCFKWGFADKLKLCMPLHVKMILPASYQEIYEDLFTSLLHKGEQLIEKVLSPRFIVDFVQLKYKIITLHLQMISKCPGTIF